MKQGKILLVAAFLTAVFCLAMNVLAYAEDCPPGVPSCKVVVMTPQEIQSLEGSGLILDSALWANRANLSAAIDAWKQKIAASPNGTVKSVEPAKKQDKLPEKK